MANPTNTLRTGQWSQHRVAVGAPVGADAAMDAADPPRRALLNCLGWETILVAPVLTGGAAPTVTLQVVGFDPDADAFRVLDTVTGVADGVATAVKVYGQRVYLRITATANNPTQVELRVAPGAPGAPQ